MTDDFRDRVAGSLLAMLPFYHRHILRTGNSISGLRTAQYRALGMLMKSGSLTMSELGGLLFISKAYMTVLADSLVENGWAERKSDPNDRRVILIAITRSGKRHLRQAFDVYRSDVKELFSGLEQDDLQKMSEALDTLQGIFTKLER